MAKRQSLSDKIRELEADNARLMEQLKAAHTQIESHNGSVDDAFLESGSRKQMESEIEKWKGLYKAKELHNKSLQDQLTEIKRAYQKTMEQLEAERQKTLYSTTMEEHLREQLDGTNKILEKVLENRKKAGRKPVEQTAAFARFSELYDSGSSRKEIEDIMGISDATYFRYQKLKRESEISINELMPGDIVTVQCLDDDRPMKGTVCRDSSGKLYVEGSNGVEHYPSGTDKVVRIGHK